jgi:carboxylesterase
MSSTDDDPHLSLSTDKFFLPGSGLSVLLIHGLTGTPYEMRYVGERLAAAGARVYGVRLAGHGGPPEDLGSLTHANWYESVVEGFELLRAYGDPNVVVGLSMGALLGARLTADQPEAVAGLAMLAPSFYLPPRVQWALRAMRPLMGIAEHLYFHSGRGSDIHDSTARRIHPGNRLLPMKAALNLIQLSDYVRPRLRQIEQPVLVIHSRNDHTCPFEKNTRFVMKALGTNQKRLITLEESFHVITVDSEKDKVAAALIDFALEFRPAATRRAANG